MKKILRFFKSLLFHIGAGLPKSTQQEIDERFAICSSCDSHSKSAQMCLECGCNINNKRIFLNKLAWADQQCPLNKWLRIKR